MDPEGGKEKLASSECLPYAMLCAVFSTYTNINNYHSFMN